MHLPDGIIPINQAIIYWIIILVFIGFYFYKIRKTEDYKYRLISTAIFSAAVAVCSAISIPTPFGIPIHFFLIPLAVLILGPNNGVIVTFIALLVQALFLGMGGIVSLGVNVFIMGIIISFVTFGFYKLFININKSLAVFIGTLTGIIFASICQMLIILISGSGNFEILTITLVPFYILVGIIEGFINIIIMSFIEKMKPEMLDLEKI